MSDKHYIPTQLSDSSWAFLMPGAAGFLAEVPAIPAGAAALPGAAEAASVARFALPRMIPGVGWGIAAGTAAWYAYQWWKNLNEDAVPTGRHIPGFTLCCATPELQCFGSNTAQYWGWSGSTTCNTAGCRTTCLGANFGLNPSLPANLAGINSIFRGAHHATAGSQLMATSIWVRQNAVNDRDRVSMPGIATDVRVATENLPREPMLEPNVERAKPANTAESMAGTGQPAPFAEPHPGFTATHTFGRGGRTTRVQRQENPQPKRKEDKEKKTKSVGTRVADFLDFVSESAEVVDAVYQALPDDVKKRWSKGRKERPGDSMGQYGLDGADWKLQAIYHNWEKIDGAQAVANVLANEFEDRVYGKAFGAQDKVTGRGRYRNLPVTARFKGGIT